MNTEIYATAHENSHKYTRELGSLCNYEEISVEHLVGKGKRVQIYSESS